MEKEKATVMIRVRPSTLDRLEAAQQSLIEYAQAGRSVSLDAPDWRDRGPWISLDAVVSHLLDQRDGHHRRVRRAAARARARRAAEKTKARGQGEK